ncbi:MAG: RsmD family RNA methyltransferase [Leptospiraceae bacterium]|nr:RsmD family RNA methyltransferase [Leptospiraceae bacterium]
MNPSLRIQTGRWKGRAIPIPSQVKGNSNFTPAILKKSIFSILDGLREKGKLSFKHSAFIDLFAGSGQMGMEALSNGFAKVLFYEMAKERFAGLVDLLKEHRDSAYLFKKDSFRQHSNLPELDGIEHLVYFIDPPYLHWSGSNEKIHSLVDGILSSSNLPKTILIQAPNQPKLVGYSFRELGNHSLYLVQTYSDLGITQDLDLNDNESSDSEVDARK